MMNVFDTTQAVKHRMMHMMNDVMMCYLTVQQHHARMHRVRLRLHTFSPKRTLTMLHSRIDPALSSLTSNLPAIHHCYQHLHHSPRKHTHQHRRPPRLHTPSNVRWMICQLYVHRVTRIPPLQHAHCHHQRNHKLLTHTHPRRPHQLRLITLRSHSASPNRTPSTLTYCRSCCHVTHRPRCWC